MKKLFALALALVLAFSLAACTDDDDTGTDNSKTNPTTGMAGNGTAGADGGSNGALSETPPEAPPGETIPAGQKSPPNCIWTLTGTVNGSVDVGARKGMPGMYQIFLFEFQFDNLSGEYPSGKYDGSVYVESTIDASEFIENALKDIPAGMNIDLKSYGLRNGVSFIVYNYWNYQQDRNLWPSTSDQDGNPVTPNRDEYVAEGTVAINYAATATGGGWGDTGGGSFELGDFTSTGSGTEDIQVRFLIEPNSVWGDSFYTSSAGSRNVKIYVGVGGDWFVGDGKLTRQPGGLENQTKFTRDMPESLGEKHGVDPTS